VNGEVTPVIDGRNQALVVDDEPEDLKTLCESLAHLGYDVITAGDATSALREFFAHRESISLVVTDVAMSPINGCDLAAILLKANPELRIVFVSGYAGTEAFRYEQRFTKAIPFLRKPLKLSELEAQVQDILTHV
jgi:two-component system, cell cycle sensor histidine kinase and response regulator CckA